ncbi:signal peptidase I [Enterococcus sp. 7F3_DIV0205]|uniref:Signal peptidase I n=1 Tax=Candidatus Enterococcus palustris TaxID=1834189 RepID=A0AAQ3WAX4_9ENTE|nr:signal peptidase I [Enterococcus sp. 7F3_DIV0205]OTN84527.1 signal peptidase I [Enterococcus sp. 7F3_DIV0205]
MRKIRRFLATVYLFVIIVFIIFSVILRFNNGISYFGYQVRVVMSDSMSPEIPKNSLVLVKEIGEEVAVGDVVTLEFAGEYVTHRVVAITENSQGVVYETKGDTNEFSDERQRRKEEIVGKVIFSIPSLGTFFLLIGTSRGMTAFILSLLLLILLRYFFTLLRENSPSSEKGIKLETRN